MTISYLGDRLLKDFDRYSASSLIKFKITKGNFQNITKRQQTKPLILNLSIAKSNFDRKKTKMHENEDFESEN